MRISFGLNIFGPVNPSLIFWEQSSLKKSREKKIAPHTHLSSPGPTCIWAQICGALLPQNPLNVFECIYGLGWEEERRREQAVTLLPDLKDSAGVAWYGMVGLHGTHFFFASCTQLLIQWGHRWCQQKRIAEEEEYWWKSSTTHSLTVTGDGRK